MNSELTIKPKTSLPDQDIVVKDLNGWCDRWYQSILPEKNKLSLLFDDFDKHFKGKLRSKLVPIIGYGGTLKSLYAQNIGLWNMKNNGAVLLYSTMEMGVPVLINRFICMEIEGDKYQSAYELEYKNNKRILDARQIYQDTIGKLYKEKFFITENSSLTTEQYEKAILELKGKGIKTDILIVDGLAGMGGSGSETELYSKHSKELKDLANRYEMLILLICHVSKGGKKTDKDCSQIVRSSEKIIDNCDFYISMSIFEDDAGERIKGIGNARVVDKRGTGDVIDVNYELNGKTLLMSKANFEQGLL